MRSRPRRKHGKRSGPMAELMLDERAQLAEGLVVFGNQEQGIIAEPRRSRGPRGSFARGRHPRLRAGSFRKDRRAPGAAKRRAAAVVGGFGERLQHLAIVGLVIRGLTGVPRRKDPRRTSSASTVRPESSATTQADSARASSDAFLRALPANVSASSTTSGAAAKSSTERITAARAAGSAPTAGR